MPWTARLLNIRTTPNAPWAFALSGLSLSALPRSASAERSRSRAVFGQPIGGKAQIDPCATDQRVDIVRIEIEGAVEVKTRLVEKIGGCTFVQSASPRK